MGLNLIFKDFIDFVHGEIIVMKQKNQKKKYFLMVNNNGKLHIFSKIARS